MSLKITKSKGFRQEYCGTVVKIGEILPIEGRDRIVKTMVNGLSIVIGKNEFQTGDVAVYCANETQLHELFLHLNSMYDDKELNIDKEKKGYINKHGRVRIVKLGGVPSYGILLNPTTIATFLNESIDDVKAYLEKHVNEDFDEINGEIFCKVYVPPVKEGSRRLSKSERRDKKLARFKMLIEGSFRQHYDTGQLARNMHLFEPEDVVYISNKIHGCVDGSTIINTLEYGDKTIKEIVDNRIRCKIKSYDIENDEVVYVSIDDYYLLRDDGEWYEIELDDGRKLLITGNNPVWMPTLNCYRKTEELKEGDILLID